MKPDPYKNMGVKVIKTEQSGESKLFVPKFTSKPSMYDPMVMYTLEELKKEAKKAVFGTMSQAAEIQRGKKLSKDEIEAMKDEVEEAFDAYWKKRLKKIIKK